MAYHIVPKLFSLAYDICGLPILLLVINLIEMRQDVVYHFPIPFSETCNLKAALHIAIPCSMYDYMLQIRLTIVTVLAKCGG